MTSFPKKPVFPTHDTPEATAAFKKVIDSITSDGRDDGSFQNFVDNADARHAWLLSDILRFVGSAQFSNLIFEIFENLIGANVFKLRGADESPWKAMTDALIAWDLPAPPDYIELKGLLFTAIDARWEPLFADPDATADYRHVTWGGVFIDDRPLGDPKPCTGRGCIPALDDPKLVSADEGSYYPDAAPVFGIVENGEAVAFPKNMMEIHEMTNMTIGGRRFGIPYCTLCGAAQAYYTDAQSLPAGVATPVLRTSGLLQRSNKFMYDLVTGSTFDTFTGAANAGPLREKGVVLEQASVALTSWGAWKKAHPETKIIAKDGGIGRDYPMDPLRGRDDDGPIFPIGDPDPRLPVQEMILGLIDGEARLALRVSALRKALENSETVEIEGYNVTFDGAAFHVSKDGRDIVSHQAFWFAWSQFYPQTQLWDGHKG